MANGDFDVRTISKSRVAGGGHDINGAAKNNKIQVVAEITGDYLTGGIVLNAMILTPLLLRQTLELHTTLLLQGTKATW